MALCHHERVVIGRGSWLLLAEDHLAKRFPEVMIPQSKIGRHEELIGEMFEDAIGLWVIIVDEISGKHDKGWRWVEAVDLGNRATERGISIDTMRYLACVSDNVCVRYLNEIPGLLHNALSTFGLPAPRTSFTVGL